MQLRNCILLALAFDATQQEIDAAHDILDRLTSGEPGIEPGIIVAAQVSSATGAIQTEGSGNAISNAPVGELDKDGLPWDDRIHSSNRNKNADGTWRAKRNLDKNFKAQVEAQLKASLGATTTVVAETAAPASLSAGPSLNPPSLGGAPIPGASLTPQIDPVFAATVALIGANTKSPANPNGLISDDYVRQILTYYGVPDGDIQNLAHMGPKIKEVYDYIAGDLRKAGVTVA